MPAKNSQKPSSCSIPAHSQRPASRLQPKGRWLVPHSAHTRVKSHVALCRWAWQSRGARVCGACCSLEEPGSNSNKTVMGLKNTTRNPVVSLLDLQTSKFTLFRGRGISSRAKPTHSHTVSVVLTHWTNLSSSGSSFVTKMVPRKASWHPEAV